MNVARLDIALCALQPAANSPGGLGQKRIVFDQGGVNRDQYPT
jgi:hypothetical protein